MTVYHTGLNYVYRWILVDVGYTQDNYGNKLLINMVSGESETY